MIKSIIFLLFLSISFANCSTIELTNKNFDKTIRENNKTVVMFSASWCGACASMKPIYKELSNDLDSVVFATVDTDREDNISNRYNIKSIPTTIVFENSKEINKEIGALNKIELLALIEPKIEENICSSTDKENMKKCFDIAKMYRYQSTMTNANSKALKFFNQLCDNSYMEGCLNIGYIYYHGDIVEQNLSKALKFFDKACRGGEQSACISIGIMYRDGVYLPQNVKKATEIFKKACDSGSDFGCYHLARSYENGRGIEQNGTKALLLHKRICDKNSANDYSRYESCTQVGQIYKYARGVEQNFSEALKYYKIACDRGSSMGCNNLGLMYANAEGVEKNTSMAIKLYTISCEADNSTGCYNLGGTYAFGWDGVQKDIDKGLKFFEKSCNLGDMEACYNIGKIYLKEKNNKVKAKEYYQYACDNGYDSACKEIDLLKSKEVDEDKKSDVTVVIFIILSYLFMIIMHFKQKRVLLENKEFKTIEEVPFLFSWSMVIFGWFVPLFRKHGSGMFAFILLIIQIVTSGLGIIIWAFFCNRNYIKKLLYIGYEPANEESKILLASKNIIDLSEIDPDKLPKKRNVVSFLIWLIKTFLIIFALVMISVVLADIFVS